VTGGRLVRRHSAAALLLSLLLLVPGCSRIRVETQRLAPADFTRFETWDWAPQDAAQGSPYAERIRDAIRRNLTPRGFRFRPGGGDFLIAFGGFTENVLQSGWAKKEPDELGSGIYAEAYGRRQGVLSIEIIDPATRKPVWRGTARVSLVLNSPSEKMERIDRAVYRILKRMPVLGERAGRE